MIIERVKGKEQKGQLAGFCEDDWGCVLFPLPALCVLEDLGIFFNIIIFGSSVILSSIKYFPKSVRGLESVLL